MADRGRDTSRHLTEVRTVLGTAENALWALGNLASRGYQDVDDLDMDYALKECVRLLSRWRRTGRPLKKKGV